MPRKSRTVYKEQAYDLGDGVTVTIKYPADKKPAMRHDDRVAMVSTDPDGFLEAAPVSRPFVGSVGAIRSRSMSPEELAEAKARLGLEDEPKEEKRKPLSSADVFAAAGLDPRMIGAIESAAEANG